MAKEAVESRAISVRLACEALFISQNCYRYQPKLSGENAEIADWLVRLTYNQKNWGFGLCFLFLRNVKGFRWNHKRVYRIYRELELNLRIKPKKRIVREVPESLAVPSSMNETWSMDFMHDSLECGRPYRLFNVIDDYNGEGLGIEIDFSLPSERVIRSLEQIIEWRGKPKVLRCDNGPEYISEALRTWAETFRGAAGKTPFVAAVACSSDGRPLAMRMTPLAGFRSDSIDRWARQHLSSDAEVTSDGLPCFRAIVETCSHWSTDAGGGPLSVEKQEFTWVNTMLGNVKNAIHGTYHAIAGKHLGRYLGALAYRFNRRFEFDRMVERFAYVACRTTPLPRRFAAIAEIHT